MYPISAIKVANILREAANAHHESERYLPQHDWQDWYGAFVASRLNTKADVTEAATFADSAIRVKLMHDADNGNVKRAQA